MNIRRQKIAATATLLIATLLLTTPAAAFRCGSKLVKDGMLESQVVAICGQPSSMRDLGVVLRGYDYRFTRRIGPGWTEYHRPGVGGYVQEVVLTEYVYNFGPRRLMRRLLFEGGVLVTIESAGYGYRE